MSDVGGLGLAIIQKFSVPILGLGKAFGSVSKSISNSLTGVMKNVMKASNDTGEFIDKSFTARLTRGLMPLFRKIGGSEKNAEKIGGAFKVIGGIGMGVFGIILDLLEKLGVFEPIFEVLGALMGMLGGELMDKLMPVIIELIDILLSDDMMTLIGCIADLLVAILVPLMQVITLILPYVIQFFILIIPYLTLFVNIIVSGIVPAILWLVNLFTFLVNLFVFIGEIIWQFIIFPFQVIFGVFKSIGDVIKLVVNGVIGFINIIIDLINLLSFGAFDLRHIKKFGSGGIVTSPTIAIIGEAGPERIIPLNQDTGSKELLWEMQNHRDILIELLTVQRKMYRRTNR